MKTRTVPYARQNLGTSQRRPIRGAGEVVALRPVKVHSEDYALQEYGVTAAERGRAEVKIGKQLAREKAWRWDGTVAGLRTRSRHWLKQNT